MTKIVWEVWDNPGTGLVKAKLGLNVRNLFTSSEEAWQAAETSGGGINHTRKELAKIGYSVRARKATESEIQ